MISSIDTSTLNDTKLKRRSMIHAMVRAKQDYIGQLEGELSFERGQQFTVLPGEQEKEYYLVVNPDTKQKGKVLVNMMEYFAANNNLINQVNANNVLNNNINKVFKQRIGFALTTITKPEIGYMEINKDDALLIIDQCDDYYIAKPIGKLGIPAKILIKDVMLQQEVNKNKPTVNKEIPNKILNQMQPLSPKEKDHIKTHNKINLSLSFKLNNKDNKDNKDNNDNSHGTRRRGSIQPKALYANSLGVFFPSEEEERKSSNYLVINEFNLKDIKAIEMINLDGIDYIQIDLEYPSEIKTIFRRQEDISLLYDKIQLLELNLSDLPDLPNFNFKTKILEKQKYHLSHYEQYLIDIEIYLWDLLYINNSLINLQLYKFFKQMDLDRNIKLSLKHNFNLIQPIQTGPSFSNELMSLNFSNNITKSKTVSLKNTPLINQANLPPINTPKLLKIKLQIEDNLFSYYLKSSPPDYSEFQHSLEMKIGYLPNNIQFKNLKSNRIMELNNHKHFDEAIQSNDKGYLYVIV